MGRRRMLWRRLKKQDDIPPVHPTMKTEVIEPIDQYEFQDHLQVLSVIRCCLFRPEMRCRKP
jgi:hypothetical protein